MKITERTQIGPKSHCVGGSAILAGGQWVMAGGEEHTTKVAAARSRRLKLSARSVGISGCTMLWWIVLLWSLASCSALSSEADEPTMRVLGRLSIPDGSSVSGTKVTLNGEQFECLSRADGSFHFGRVPSGIYLVDVLSTHEVFSQLKIKVNAAEQTVGVVEYKYPGAKRQAASYPLQFTAMSPLNYFQVKPPFSVMGFVMGNPMIVIMGAVCCMMVYFPKMLKELDPEGMKAYEESTKDVPSDPREIFAQLFGGGGGGGGDKRS